MTFREIFPALRVQVPGQQIKGLLSPQPNGVSPPSILPRQPARRGTQHLSRVDQGRVDEKPPLLSRRKSRLASTIVPRIPPDHDCYCEPFCGAAWILFAKEPSRCEVINDADGELVAFWRVVQHHLLPFLDYFKWAIVSRRIFDLENLKRPETLTDIQRAVRYYYLQRLAFGGKPSGRSYGYVTSGGPRLNLTDVSETLLDVHSRLERVNVECLDALDCIRRYDLKGTFFFIDPPYIFNTHDYVVSFDRFEALSDILGKIKGRFILTMTDCPEVRRIFEAFKISSVRLKYSINRPLKSDGDARSKDRREVIVQNY